MKSCNIFLLTVLATLWFKVDAQCPVAQFTDFPNACRSENIQLANTSSNSTRYYWDFCSGDMKATPIDVSLSTSSVIIQPYSYKAIYTNNKWYGFIIDRASKKLIKVNFGGDLKNTTPSFTDLGDFGGLFNSPTVPEDLDIIQVNNKWYMFVTRDGFGGIVLVDLGSDLDASVPTASNIGTFGVGSKIRGVSLAHDGSRLIMAITGSNQFLTLVNFGNSPSNVPTLSDILTVTIPGASPILSALDIVQTCNGWLIFAGTYGTNKIHKLRFGNDLFAQPQNVFTYPIAGVNEPWDIDILTEGSRTYVAISDLSLPFVVADFGNIDLDETPAIVPTANPFGTKSISIDLIAYEGEILLDYVYYATSTFKRLNFAATCGNNIQFSDQQTPPLITYSSSGTFSVALKSFAGNRESNFERAIAISDADAPLGSIWSDKNCIDHQVDLSLESTNNISQYDWDFGDLTSHQFSASPAHVFSSTGQFGIALKVVGLNGCKNSFSKNIHIYDVPVPAFTLPSGLICTNNQITFSNSTTDNFDGNLSYEWFVDNQSVSTVRDLNYTFLTTGTKEIKLKTSIPGCSDEIAQITPPVGAGPIIDFSFSGKCEDEEVQFMSNISETVTSQTWNFADGNTSADVNPKNIFSDPGSYAVSLSALSPSGCNNSKTKTINIFSKPATNFSVAAPPSSCTGVVTNFTDATPSPDDSEITNWQWDFDDVINNASNIQNAAHIYSTAGDYSVSLAATTDRGCSNSFSKSVTIYQSPSAAISNTVACNALPVNFSASGSNIQSYYWELGASYYTTSNPTHTFNLPGNYNVKLTVKASNNCEYQAVKSIVVPIPLSPDFSLIKNCVGYDAVFNDMTTGSDPVVQQTWETPGLGIKSGSSISYNFASTGNKNIKLTVQGQSGCSYSKTRIVNIVSAPVAGFEVSPQSGAVPLVSQFTNTSTGSSSYLWSFGDGSNTSNLLSPSYTFQNVGDYSVELTASNAEGCESKISKTISAQTPIPDVDVKLITYSQNPDGSLKVIITLQNKGNTIVRNLPVDIDVSGITSIREIIPGPIQPVAFYNLVLGYTFTDPEKLNFFCATSTLQDDVAPADNHLCKELEDKISIMEAFPNPARTTLQVNWIAPEQELVNVVIVDMFGKRLLDTNVTSVSGLNEYSYNVSALESGLYLLIVKSRLMSKTQRILVAR